MSIPWDKVLEATKGYAIEEVSVHFDEARRSWEPDFAVNPGETIRETLKQLGISGSEAADRMGVTQPYVANLLAGRKGIGPVTALKLEDLTGVRAEVWARLWAQYAVALERNRR